MFDLSELHIEVSSRCVLKCPRCPRTELPELHSLNRDYTINEFKIIFPPELLRTVQRIVFCGDIGDPLYARDILTICEYIKKTNPKLAIRIVTNGSYQSAGFWEILGQHLNKFDTITFSIDGWDQSSNEKYRVNSNYASILTGIQCMVNSPVLVNCSTIVFNFNEDHLDSMADYLKGLGVDSWQIVNSTKFGDRYLVDGVDPLQPKHVTNSTVYERKSYNFTDRREPKVLKKSTDNWQKCMSGMIMPFISVTGEFYPCPWFNSGYMDNEFIIKHRDSINVRTRDIIEIANDNIWNELWEMMLPICRYKCYENS